MMSVKISHQKYRVELREKDAEGIDNALRKRIVRMSVGIYDAELGFF